MNLTGIFFLPFTTRISYKTPVPKVADNKESPQVVPVAFNIAFPVLQILVPVVGS
jgi:hypothetical protein